MCCLMALTPDKGGGEEGEVLIDHTGEHCAFWPKVETSKLAADPKIKSLLQYTSLRRCDGRDCPFLKTRRSCRKACRRLDTHTKTHTMRLPWVAFLLSFCLSANVGVCVCVCVC